MAQWSASSALGDAVRLLAPFFSAVQGYTQGYEAAVARLALCRKSPATAAFLNAKAPSLDEAVRQLSSGCGGAQIR